MKSALLTFVLTFALAFGGGYLFFQSPDATETGEASSTTTEQEATGEENSEEEVESMPVGTVDSMAGETLDRFSCLSCHAVSGLGLDGGVTGPDLSQAFVTTEGKHGKPLDEYLKEPTSAVMSTVISGNPMTDEEIDAIVSILKEASEQ